MRWQLLRNLRAARTANNALWHEGGLCVFVLFLVGLYSQAFASGGNVQGGIKPCSVYGVNRHMA